MENPHEKFWDSQMKEHKKMIILIYTVEYGVYDQN